MEMFSILNEVRIPWQMKYLNSQKPLTKIKRKEKKENVGSKELKNNRFPSLNIKHHALESAVQWRCFMTKGVGLSIKLTWPWDAYRKKLERNDLNLSQISEAWHGQNAYTFSQGKSLKNLFTEAEEFKAYKILFSSVLTTSDMGFFLNLKSLWEPCRGLRAGPKLPGYKVIQWY